MRKNVFEEVYQKRGHWGVMFLCALWLVWVTRAYFFVFTIIVCFEMFGLCSQIILCLGLILLCQGRVLTPAKHYLTFLCCLIHPTCRIFPQTVSAELQSPAKMLTLMIWREDLKNWRSASDSEQLGDNRSENLLQQ